MERHYIFGGATREIGKRPVWSLETLPLILMVRKYHSLSRTRPWVGGVEVVTGEGVCETMEGIRVGFVERWLDQAVCRWLLAVARYLGKCWWMRCDVSPGQVEKDMASMVAVQVLGTGMKQYSSNENSGFIVHSLVTQEIVQ